MSEVDKAAEAAAAEEATSQHGPAPEVDVAALQQALADAQAKAEDSWNRYLAARAEVENIRKRTERDLANAHKFALEKFVNELLPVKDSLEMGLAAANEGNDLAKLKEGKKLTLKMLASTLGKFGVKEVDPQGEKFNPELHEAMAMQPSAEQAPNTVLQVVQKGYLLHDRLVRPAMVIVSQSTN